MTDASHQEKFKITLLAPVAQQECGPSIELCGSRWSLVEFSDLSEAPPYTCVSYTWGKGRTENILKSGSFMSDRAVAVTEAAIQATRRHSTKQNTSQAIWIDSLCVPHEGVERSECLYNMGAIYNGASQVVVVLASSCAAALRKMQRGECLSECDISALENDAWITRAWTYQEAENAKRIRFISEGNTGAIFDAYDLLEHVIEAGAKLRGTAGVWGLALSQTYRNLNNLQDIIAGWMAGDHWGRSVFQIMVAFRMRHDEMGDGNIYPMIGALHYSSLQRFHDSAFTPAEFFMKACESMGDYSFIFCTAPRSEMPGRRWRPTGNELTALVSGVLTVGRGLPGHQEGEGLRLNDVSLIVQGKVDINKIKGLLYLNEGEATSSGLMPLIRLRLKAMEFSGTGDFIEMECGYFFPYSHNTPSEDLVVVASKELLWDGGGPAILVKRNREAFEFRDIGIFFGRLPENNQSIKMF